MKKLLFTQDRIVVNTSFADAENGTEDENTPQNGDNLKMKEKVTDDKNIILKENCNNKEKMNTCGGLTVVNDS